MCLISNLLLLVFALTKHILVTQAHHIIIKRNVCFANGSDHFSFILEK